MGKPLLSPSPATTTATTLTMTTPPSSLALGVPCCAVRGAEAASGRCSGSLRLSEYLTAQRERFKAHRSLVFTPSFIVLSGLDKALEVPKALENARMESSSFKVAPSKTFPLFDTSSSSFLHCVRVCAWVRVRVCICACVWVRECLLFCAPQHNEFSHAMETPLIFPLP